MWLFSSYSTKLYLSAFQASLRPAKFRKLLLDATYRFYPLRGFWFIVYWFIRDWLTGVLGAIKSLKLINNGEK